ncbi:MAG: hypothetical protein NXI24_18320 [bacterium]|nr:hypothetical protein [bacterium]
MLFKTSRVFIVALALSVAQCTGFNDDDDDDAAVVAAALLAVANANANSAAFTITNNSGGTRTYSLHLSGSNCTNAAAGNTGSVANGAVGSVSVQSNSTGYDITDGTTCSAVVSGTRAGVFTCTDTGTAISC